MINILWKVANQGEVLFVGRSESDEALINKMLKLNNIEAVYDFVHLDLYSSEQFQTFLSQKRSSVLILTAE